MREPLLTAQNLTVGYRKDKHRLPVLRQLNLEVKPGQLVCFMGPNGIGKSTLIRTLAGILPPLEGTITCGVPALPRQSWSSYISVVLTDKISASHMTARELIAFGRYPWLGWDLKLTPTDIQVIDETAKVTRTSMLLNKKISELSDGQMQLVMLARALAQQTPLLLLDEPTAHLDLNNRVEIMNLLRTLARKENKGIVVATHELDLALQTADWLWLAGKDQQLLTGMPEDLVLNGAFDDIFQFKGFDLKTGKVQHECWRETTVQVEGEGPELLWTKNAFDRLGFRVTHPSDLVVTLNRSSDGLRWICNNRSYTSLYQLMAELIS